VGQPAIADSRSPLAVVDGLCAVLSHSPLEPGGWPGRPGGCPARAPTDPDVRLFRIRLVRSTVYRHGLSVVVALTPSGALCPLGVSLRRLVDQEPPSLHRLRAGSLVRRLRRYCEALRLLYARFVRLIGFAVTIPPLTSVASLPSARTQPRARGHYGSAAPRRPMKVASVGSLPSARTLAEGQGPLRFGRPKKAERHGGDVQISQVPGEP